MIISININEYTLYNLNNVYYDDEIKSYTPLYCINNEVNENNLNNARYYSHPQITMVQHIQVLHLGISAFVEGPTFVYRVLHSSRIRT